MGEPESANATEPSAPGERANAEAEIAARAYAYWLHKGCPSGSQLDDWLHAEADLRRIDEVTRQLEAVRRHMHEVETLFETQIASRWRLEATLRRSEVIHRAILDCALDAVITIDHRGRVIEFSPAAEMMFGYGRDEARGMLLAELIIPPALRPAYARGLARCLATGEGPLLGHRSELTAQRGNGTEFPAEVSVVRIPRVDPPVFAGFVRDLTESRRARLQAEAEHAVAHVLAETGTFAAACPRLLQNVCEILGWDAGTFWSLDNRTDMLQCTELFHVPECRIEEFRCRAAQAAVSAGTDLPGCVLAERAPLWISDLSQRCEPAWRAGLRTAVGIPVGVAGRFVGMIEYFSRTARPLDAALLATLVSIGNQISQYIERRQAEVAVSGWERELSLAREIQQGLLPRERPVVAGFEIGSDSLPAQQTGGDYLDFFPLNDGSLAVVIGDASGHGLGSALLMAETRAYLRALSLTHTDPAAILTLTNQRLADDTGGHSFVTLFFARLDPHQRTLVYSSAGHWPAYVFDTAGDLRAVLGSTDIPLSLDPTGHYICAPEATLRPGDLLFLFTDGIIEALSAELALFGVSRTLEYVGAHRRESPDEILSGLFQTVLAHCDNAPQDDMSALILKVR